MADPYGRHHTAIDDGEETIAHSFFRHTHNNNPFWNSSTLTLVCSAISHEVPSQISFTTNSNEIHFIWLLHPPHAERRYTCMLCVCACFFLIFAWYRLITYPCPYIFEHHRIGHFSMFYYCNLCCGNFYVNDKTRRKIYYVFWARVCVCTCWSTIWIGPIRFFLFWDWDCVCMIIAMISIDLDKVQSTGNHRTCEN